MILQIKKIGSNSKGLIFNPALLKYHDLDVDDYVDVSDIHKAKPPTAEKLVEEEKENEN